MANQRYNRLIRAKEKMFVANLTEHISNFDSIITIAKFYNVDRRQVYKWIDKHLSGYDPKELKRAFAYLLIEADLFSKEVIASFLKCHPNSITRYKKEMREGKGIN